MGSGKKKQSDTKLDLFSWIAGGPIVTRRATAATDASRPSSYNKIEQRLAELEKERFERIALEEKKKKEEEEAAAAAKKAEEEEATAKKKKEHENKQKSEEKTETKEKDADSSKNNNDKKADEKKDEAKPSDKTDNTEESSWTEKQDADILALKAESKSWKDIAAAVGATKSQVQQRHKELLKKAEEEKSDKVEDKAEQKTPKTDKKEDKKPTPVTQNNNHAHCPQCHRCLSCNPTEPKANEQQGGEEKTSNDEQLAASQPSPPSQPADSPRLIADAFFNTADCQALENLYGQFKKDKWLHMQSAYYNMTGRMIPPEFLKAKFAEAGEGFDN